MCVKSATGTVIIFFFILIECRANLTDLVIQLLLLLLGIP